MSACVDKLVNELVDDVNGFFNIKAQLLRSLFINKKQFENLIVRDCNGNLQGDFMHNFSESELDFMENFLQVFELGLDQLEKFMSMLASAEGLLKLDECTILYYLRQILNGPFSCAAYDLSRIISGQDLNLLASVNDGIGTLGNTVRSNAATTVYGLEPFNAALDLYNKLPPFMQKNISDGTRTSTNVFNYNFEQQIYNDNTLPYIDKFPQLRVNNEYSQGFTNFATGSLMIKDIPFFNKLKNISNDIFGTIKEALGPAANKLFEFRKFVNIFYIKGSQAFGVLNGVNRLLISLDRTEYAVNNKIIKEKCENALTNILGFPIENDRTYELQMQVGDGVYDIYTLNGLFGGPAGRTNKRPEIVDQVTEQQLEQLDISVVKKELCESEDDCKEFNF
tara:strand:+ start:2305 stop:3486 length:1182 start_codon:yes stop_codon:yes gene_type:complete